MKKRSKYRPKKVLVNPIAYVLESLAPIAEHESYLLDLRIKNSAALRALLRGEATKLNMNTLFAMANMTRALVHLGFGAEHSAICDAGRDALAAVAKRAVQHGKFVLKGPEITKLNVLMELHDAQMDIATIKDVENALAYIDKQTTSRKDIIYLPNTNLLNKDTNVR